VSRLQHSFQHSRSTAALKEKGKQTAEKIKKLIEVETVVVSDKKLKDFPTVGAGGPTAEVAENSHKACESVEFFGQGPEQFEVQPAVWGEFMGEYHAAKDDLLKWLGSNKARFTEAVFSQMENEVRDTRVMRPQNQIEPDLTWRGIAAWTRPRSGSVESSERPALIHVGAGFMELFKKDRVRARFEIARLIAQSWSTCEIAEARKLPIWHEFYQCMGLTEENTRCAAGAVSEATWALSTSVASLVSRPGCEVPAFADTRGAECLKALHAAGRSVASVAAPEAKAETKTEPKKGGE